MEKPGFLNQSDFTHQEPKSRFFAAIEHYSVVHKRNYPSLFALWWSHHQDRRPKIEGREDFFRHESRLVTWGSGQLRTIECFLVQYQDKRKRQGDMERSINFWDMWKAIRCSGVLETIVIRSDLCVAFNLGLHHYFLTAFSLLSGKGVNEHIFLG